MTLDKVEEIVGEINLNIRKDCNAMICSVCGGGGYNYDKERDCTECLASGITNWDFDFLNKQLTQTLIQDRQATADVLCALMEDLRTGYPDIENGVLFEQGYEVAIEDCVELIRATLSNK